MGCERQDSLWTHERLVSKFTLQYNPYTQFAALRLLNKHFTFSNLDDGRYIATATVCNIEKHTWAGFRLEKYLMDGRFGYVTVYFSHNGTWSGIENSKWFLLFS